MPSAHNARPDDPRCGPCHNFRITAIDGHWAILRVDFIHWVEERERAIQEADNMATFRPWLAALRAAQRKQVKP
jgi:hypothetical protein